MVLERIPLDTRVAAACDAGTLESLDIDYLAETAKAISAGFAE